MKKYFISLLLILASVMATAQNVTEYYYYNEEQYYSELYYKVLCHEYLKRFKPEDLNNSARFPVETSEPRYYYNKYCALTDTFRSSCRYYFMSVEEYERFNKGSRRGANDEIAELKNVTKSLKTELEECRTQLNRMNALGNPDLAMQIEELKNSNETLKSQNDTANKKLKNIAFNFLYIPYEAFSIKKIAIPAFNAISDPSVKEAGKVKFSLLQSYETDIKELIVCYRKIEDELDLSYDGIEYVEKIKGTDVYNNYNKYDDWENTYLGKNILLAISRMESFTRKNKTSLKDLIAELEKCLKTEEDL